MMMMTKLPILPCAEKLENYSLVYRNKTWTKTDAHRRRRNFCTVLSLSGTGRVNSGFWYAFLLRQGVGFCARMVDRKSKLLDIFTPRVREKFAWERLRRSGRSGRYILLAIRASWDES